MEAREGVSPENGTGPCKLARMGAGGWSLEYQTRQLVLCSPSLPPPHQKTQGEKVRNQLLLRKVFYFFTLYLFKKSYLRA